MDGDAVQEWGSRDLIRERSSMWWSHVDRWLRACSCRSGVSGIGNGYACYEHFSLMSFSGALLGRTYQLVYVTHSVTAIICQMCIVLLSSGLEK